MEILKKVGKLWKLVLASFILLGSSAFAQPVHIISNRINNPNGSVTLPYHVPREVALGLATEVSDVNPTQILDLRIVLPSKNQSGLDSLFKSIYNPKSPNFRKFLTHKQVIQQFGVDAVNSSIVIGQLKSYGFTIKSQSDDGCIISATGPASAIHKMFNLNIKNYKKKSDGTKFFAPDSNPTLQPPLVGKVSMIVGMDNVRKHYPHFHRNKATGTINPLPKIAANSKVTKAVTPKFSGPDSSVAPSDILTAYNVSPLTAMNPSIVGTGETQALFELDGFVPGDITQFLNQFGISYSLSNITVVPVDGGITTVGEGISEVDLDIDLTIAVAPGLKSVLVYEADQNTNINAWVDEWTKIYSDDTAQVISCSWGGPESGPDPAHTIFEEMAVQGQTVLAAAGDSGAYDNCQGGSLPGQTQTTAEQYCNTTYGSTYCVYDDQTTPVQCVQAQVVANDPTTDPYITGVGISVLSVNGSEAYSSETSSLYGGGGISGTWPISDSSSTPTYSYQGTVASQTAVAYPASSVSTTMRNVPDVVFTADPATPYFIYITDPLNSKNTGWYTIWGSSAASPIWAAFIARVNQGKVAAGESVIGFLNPTMYQVYSQNQSTCTSTPSSCDFHDITTGTNDYYPAEAGFDDATGLGSFNGLNLYNDLTAGIPGPPTTVTAVPGNTTAVVAFSGAVANGSPILTYTVTSNPAGGTGSGPASPITVTGLTNGITYTFTVTATNANGPGTPSSASNSIVPGSPLSPTSVSAVAGNNQVTVTFTPGADNGSAITGYTATSSPGGLTGTCTGAACSPIIVSNLINGTSYTFTVTAANGIGTSPASMASNSAIPYGVPSPPTTVTAVAGNGQATVSFSGATNNGSVITGYTATSVPGGFTGNGTSSPIVVTGLANGGTYAFTVTASNMAGTSVASGVSNSVTPTALAGPTNLKGTILGARIGGRIVYVGDYLTWVQSTAPSVVQNKIYRSTGVGAYSLLATISATTSYVDTNVTKGASYNYEVSALNSSGAESLLSTSVTVNY